MIDISEIRNVREGAWWPCGSAWRRVAPHRALLPANFAVRPLLVPDVALRRPVEASEALRVRRTAPIYTLLLNNDPRSSIAFAATPILDGWARSVISGRCPADSWDVEQQGDPEGAPAH